MRRSRVPIAEKRAIGSKTKHNSSQQKEKPIGPSITRKNFSVSMINTRSMKESAQEKQTERAIEIDLETPDQSVDEVERKTTKSTPMPNADEQNQKSMEFSRIDTVKDTTGKMPETIKDESQVKRTTSRDVATLEPKAEKGRTVGTVSTITTEANKTMTRSSKGQQPPMKQNSSMKKLLLLNWVI